MITTEDAHDDLKAWFLDSVKINRQPEYCCVLLPVKGAERVLQHRSLTMSGDLDEYWAFHIRVREQKRQNHVARDDEECLTMAACTSFQSSHTRCILMWDGVHSGIGIVEEHSADPGDGSCMVQRPKEKIMGYRADFATIDPLGAVTLIIEAKARLATTPEWARNVRRNLLVYGIESKARYFMLALPDWLYLWKQFPPPSPDALPEFSLRATSIFAPYFQRLQVDPETVRPSTFEFIVASWITDLLQNVEENVQIPGDQAWLLDSGLLEAIKGAQLREEVEV